jgi:AraC-like DNA-binding protein
MIVGYPMSNASPMYTEKFQIQRLEAMEEDPMLRVDLQKCTRGFYLQISQDFFNFSKGNMDHVSLESGFYSRPDSEIQGDLGDILYVLHREFERFRLHRSEIIAAYLRIVVCHLVHALASQSINFPKDREREILINFLSLVKRHFATKKMVVEYASELFISPNYLNQVVKKLTGITASQHIQQYVIMEAKRQLLSSPYKMKEIAYSLGFEDCAYFSKYFKNKCGMSFSRFKKELAY